MPKHTLTFNADADSGIKLMGVFVAWLALRDDVEDVQTMVGDKKGKAPAPAAEEEDDEPVAKPATGKKAKAAPIVEEDDEEDEEPAPKAKKGKAAAADPLDELAADDNEEKDAMMASLSKLAKLTKKEGVKKILAKLKVESVDDIPEERYAAVTTAADNMIAALDEDEE